jgi:UDP-N-acetylmuramoyl-tripeptide--D-alanyl-D-alanine ligase
MLIKNLLYILQSLNYEIKPFFKFAYTHLAWWNYEKRGKLKWTLKSGLLYTTILTLCLLQLAVLYYFYKITGIIIFILSLILLPFYLILANILLKPADYFLKKLILDKAKKILAALNIKVIGITGSFGKTSTKEILRSILNEKYHVIATPENINTDIGIAEFIIKHQSELSQAEIFIVEMGAYRIGEIAKICSLVKPDYSILTGINEAHLEKFGNLNNTIKAKFELPQNTKTLSFLNLNDVNIRNNYQEFRLKNFVGINRDNIGKINYLENFKGLEFEYDGQKFISKLLAEHNLDLIILACELAKKLSLNYEQIIAGVKKIEPIRHRLELIYNREADVYVIDDSYNGNLNGILSGLKVLGRAKGRKIVLTPGLVEQGKKSSEIHYKIGELYAAQVDLVLLIKNNSSQDILKALKNKKFSDYKIYNSATEAHADLKNILRPGDTIIFQNDWPDAYY